MSSGPTVGVMLRDARPDEIEAAGLLVRAAYMDFEQTYPGESWERYITMVGELQPVEGEGQIIVAERAGELVGCITYYRDGSKSAQGEWPAGWAGIVRLAVLPSARRAGIARALVDECIDRAREQGASMLALHTTEWMAVARAMYEGMRFERDPSMDFYPRPGVVGLGYRYALR